MKILARFALALIILMGGIGLSRPAAAINQEQWTNICVNFLGLRSAATPVDTNGAGYGMDNGNTVPMACLQAQPANWNTLLATTITLIKGFPNSDGRYLLIVGGCPGLTADYPGAFPKCNTVTGAVVAATPNTLGNYTAQQLIDWVNATVPQ